MITKDNIKLAEVVYYKGKNNYNMPIERSLSIQEKYRKVIVYRNIIIDLKTSRRLHMLAEHPYKNKNSCLCILSLSDLSYTTDEDYINGLNAINNYVDDLELAKETNGKILRFRPKK